MYKPLVMQSTVVVLHKKTLWSFQSQIAWTYGFKPYVFLYNIEHSWLNKHLSKLQTIFRYYLLRLHTPKTLFFPAGLCMCRIYWQWLNRTTAPNVEKKLNAVMVVVAVMVALNEVRGSPNIVRSTMGRARVPVPNLIAVHPVAVATFWPKIQR